MKHVQTISDRHGKHIGSWSVPVPQYWQPDWSWQPAQLKRDHTSTEARQPQPRYQHGFCTCPRGWASRRSQSRRRITSCKTSTLACRWALRRFPFHCPAGIKYRLASLHGSAQFAAVHQFGVLRSYFPGGAAAGLPSTSLGRSNFIHRSSIITIEKSAEPSESNGPAKPLV